MAIYKVYTLGPKGDYIEATPGIFGQAYYRDTNEQSYEGTSNASGFPYINDNKYYYEFPGYSINKVDHDKSALYLKKDDSATQAAPDSNAEDSDEESFEPSVIGKPFFSGTNARLYIAGGEELDVVTINFTLHQAKMPLFGYKSTLFDEVAVGTIMAQGSFLLNVRNALEVKRLLFGEDMHRSALNMYLKYTADFTDKPKTGYALKNITVQDVQQIVSPSGEPLGESYSFISNNIRGINY